AHDRQRGAHPVDLRGPHRPRHQRVPAPARRRRPSAGADRMTDALAGSLAAALGAGEVTGLRRLSGGASRETWAFEADGRPLILQRERPGSPRSAGMATEAALLRAAAERGVPVPAVVASCADG